MTLDTIAPTEFDISYHGPALADGSMNVRDLAPAMMAVGSLFESTNELLNADRAAVNINVRATSGGSFHIFFEVLQNSSIANITDFLTTANQIVNLIIGGATIVSGATIGLIALIKWLRGRNPKVEQINEGMFRLTLENGETYDIPTELLTMYQNADVRNALSGMVRPVKEDGIDTLEVRQNDQLIASVAKEDADYFDTPEVQELMLDETRSHVFSIVSLAFREGNKWRLTDGQLTFSVSMMDDDFQHRVDNNAVSFAKGDLLICDMRTIQWLTHQGIKTEYEIVKVNEHMLARQPRLSGVEAVERSVIIPAKSYIPAAVEARRQGNSAIQQGRCNMVIDIQAIETASEERSVQIEMLPDADEVAAVVSRLEADDLREFAVAVMNAAVDLARNGDSDMETVRLLNGWFASMEETVAAGADVEEILSRRRMS